MILGFKKRRVVMYWTFVVMSACGFLIGIHDADAASPVKVSLRSSALSAEERTKVMVLATIHLDQQDEKASSTEHLTPLVDSLSRYKPDLVAVERLPGETLDAWERFHPQYDTLLDFFAPKSNTHGKLAQTSLNLNRRAAETEATKLGANLRGKAPQEVSKEERIRATLLFVAAYDMTSAALQWSYVQPSERVPSAGMSSELVVALSDILASHDEVTTIGVALAHRLGHQQVYAVDDQSDAPFQLEYGEKLMNEMQKSDEFKRLQESMLFQELPSRIAKAGETGNLLEFYRWINSGEYAAADVEAQWHIFFRTKFASGLDRRRSALWETRNLSIAANLRRAIADVGARRVLLIIGASHKPFLDAYFGQMMDINVVEAEEVLGN